jgi:hypothetical protein
MENVELWVNVIISILTGVATCIPLVIKLVQVIKESVKSKNCTALMQLVLKLMTEAESNYSTGEEKKAYVIDSIEAVKDTLNYDVDMDAVSAMIDSIIIASKQINVKTETETEIEAEVTEE